MTDNLITNTRMGMRDVVIFLGAAVTLCATVVGAFFAQSGRIGTAEEKASNLDKHMVAIETEARGTHDTVLILKDHQDATRVQLNRIEAYISRQAGTSLGEPSVPREYGGPR